MATQRHANDPELAAVLPGPSQDTVANIHQSAAEQEDEPSETNPGGVEAAHVTADVDHQAASPAPAAAAAATQDSAVDGRLGAAGAAPLVVQWGASSFDQPAGLAATARASDSDEQDESAATPLHAARTYSDAARPHSLSIRSRSSLSTVPAASPSNSKAPPSSSSSLHAKLQATHALLFAMLWWSLISEFPATLYAFFGIGGIPSDFFGLFATILLFVVFFGGWAAVFTVACCAGCCRRQRHHGDIRGPSTCCCANCCCCCALLPLHLRLVASPRAWQVAQVVAPIALLVRVAGPIFLQVLPVVLAVITTIAMYLQHGDALAQPRVRDTIANAAVLCFAWRWATHSASIFTLTWAGALPLALLTLATHALAYYFRPPPHQLAPSASLPRLPIATIDHSETSRAIPLALSLATLLSFTTWLGLSPTMLMHLAGWPHHYATQQLTSGQRPVFSNAAFAAALPILAAASIQLLRPTFRRLRHTQPRDKLVEWRLVLLLNVLGLALAAHADNRWLALLGACLLLMGLLSWWHALAHALGALQGGAATRLQILRIASTVWFVHLALMVLDWLGGMPPASTLLLWLLMALAVASTAWLCILSPATSSSNTSADEGEARPPVPQRPSSCSFALLAFTLVLAMALTAGFLAHCNQVAGERHMAASAAAAAAYWSPDDGLDNAATVHVVSFNVQRGFQVGTNFLNWPDVSSAITSVGAATVVGLQESASVNVIQGSKDTVAALSDSTGLRAFTGAAVGPRVCTFDGTGILSAFPVSHCSAEPLERSSVWSTMTMAQCLVHQPYKPGSDSEASGATPPPMFTFLSVHPVLVPLELKQAHVAHIAATIAAIDGPVVVVGDWNMEYDNADMEPLTKVARLTNVMNPLGLSNVTLPATRPQSNNAIDHIYYKPAGSAARPRLELLSARVMEETEGVSDHLALLASFRVLM